jgi:hypothetical protein
MFDERDDPVALGLDAAVEFQPDWLALGNPLSGTFALRRWFDRWKPGRRAKGGPKVFDSAAVVRRMLAKPAVAYRRFPCVMPSWDNTPRRDQDAVILRDATPERYEYWLAEVLRRPLPPAATADENLVFLNAWNEWAEGNHLEPDVRFGRGYLQSTRRAVQAAALACQAHTDPPIATE